MKFQSQYYMNILFQTDLVLLKKILHFALFFIKNDVKIKEPYR